MAVKAKEFRYAVDVVADGVARAEDGSELAPGPAWTPEHILLAALVRCSLNSLRHHVERSGLALADAAGAATALVTRRESDGRYAIVEATAELRVEIEPPPTAEALGELLAKAERDCFVGSSLQAKPVYRWTVNGTPARR